MVVRSRVAERMALSLWIVAALAGGARADDLPWAVVDEHGILRWEDTKREVCLFGVNYYAPFSISYANLSRSDTDPGQAVDQDLAHFSRMGLDAIRLHVFDREISTADGNLILNDHVAVLDYLLMRARERGIGVVLTPIAWWHAAGTDGFSDHYTKDQLVRDPKARRAQARYLRQFMMHRNPNTGLAYGQDPTIVAIEIINEPDYDADTTDEEIIRYANEMAEAIRSAGARQPVFYSDWNARHEVIRRAKVDGATFSWYPTGLQSGRSLTRNYLPVLGTHPTLGAAPEGKARIVYEFDAADVPGGYAYPAMARAFRSGGVQIATQFQYDPLGTAAYNSDWDTHYLNLVYAPRKAMGFAIAAEVFRRTALFAAAQRQGLDGKAPERSLELFEDVTIDFATDTVVLNATETFMYSGNTESEPKAPERLERVAGYGSSPVVDYDGAGDYFLDRVSPGVWRLEVFPDAVWVEDPFAGRSTAGDIAQLNRASRVFWRPRSMRVRLPDLGKAFAITRIGGGRPPGSEDTEDAEADREEPATESIPLVNGRFTCLPGVYVLRGEGASEPEVPISTSFVAPPPDSDPPALWHQPRRAIAVGEPLTIRATVATENGPAVNIHYRLPGTDRFEARPMDPVEPYVYEATLSPELLGKGGLDYWISVREGGEVLNWPGAWLGAGSESGPTVPDPVLLWNAGEQAPGSGPDLVEAEGQHCSSGVVRRPDGQGRALQVDVPAYGDKGVVILRHPVAAVEQAPDYDAVEIVARSERNARFLELALVEADGTPWGTNVALTSEWRTITVPLARLWRLRGFPARTMRDRLQAGNLRQVEVLSGAWLHPDTKGEPHSFQIDKIRLVSCPRTYSVAVGPDGPLVLFRASSEGRQPKIEFQRMDGRPGGWRLVSGMAADSLALRLSADGGFGASGYGVMPSAVDVEGYRLADYGVLRVRCRGAAPTQWLEVALVESDGRGWGVNVPVVEGWQDVRVPLGDLRLLWGYEPREPGDRVRLESLERVQCCFGAWLFPDTPDGSHWVEIEEIALEPGPPPAQPAGEATETPAEEEEPEAEPPVEPEAEQ